MGLNVPTALRVGQSVRFATDVDLSPYTIIRKGETGRVIFTNGPEEAEVRLDRHHPGLSQWSNCALLVPPELSAVSKACGRSCATYWALAASIVVIVGVPKLPWLLRLATASVAAAMQWPPMAVTLDVITEFADTIF